MKKQDNPQAFKHWINGELMKKMAHALSQAYPQFPTQNFLKAKSQLSNLELKARVQLIRDLLYRDLPQDYLKALKIIMDSLKTGTLKGFDLWPYTEFVQTYGLEHFDESLKALFELTQKFTAEFAVRPFLIQKPEKSYAQLLKWAEDANPHVRRWTSEGTRPRLPWGVKLHSAIQNPREGLKILEKLKFDPEIYVRKSVANHLNDIAKDHADLVVKTLSDWGRDVPPEYQAHFKWIQRHALRSLIKRGYKPALKLMGVTGSAQVRCSPIQLEKRTYKINETLKFQFQLQSTSRKTQKLIVDYIVHYRKARNQNSPKVFKLKTFEIQPGEILRIEKKHSLREVTTRRHYAGPHRLDIQINGVVISGIDWVLKLK